MVGNYYPVGGMFFGIAETLDATVLIVAVNGWVMLLIALDTVFVPPRIVPLNDGRAEDAAPVSEDAALVNEDTAPPSEDAPPKETFTLPPPRLKPPLKLGVTAF